MLAKRSTSYCRRVSHHHRQFYNSWVCALRKSSPSLRTIKLFSQMHRQSIPFDSFSILFTLKSFAHLPKSNTNAISLITTLHAHLLKLGFSSHVYVSTSLLTAYASFFFQHACVLFDEMPVKNVVTWNVMITGYSRQRDVLSARSVFDTMPVRNLESWSAMVSGYVDNALCEQGFALFGQMLMEGVRPDQVMVGTVLCGCGRVGSDGLMVGKSMHAFAVRNEWELEAELGTCLVDMYAKCGGFRNACLVLSVMKRTNVVVWSALICGAAKHGHGEAALLIFEKMRKSGMEPNEVTFTGVLNACVQAGLVDEGRRYFGMILKPGIQHYGCLVDLLGRSGMLGEAYEMIRTMPYKPNVFIWGSFLRSCKLHRQFEMADKVIDQVMGMVRPDNDGGIYSIVLDLYILNRKWSDAERIGQLMLQQTV